MIGHWWHKFMDSLVKTPLKWGHQWIITIYNFECGGQNQNMIWTQLSWRIKEANSDRRKVCSVLYAWVSFKNFNFALHPPKETPYITMVLGYLLFIPLICLVCNMILPGFMLQNNIFFNEDWCISNWISSKFLKLHLTLSHYLLKYWLITRW